MNYLPQLDPKLSPVRVADKFIHFSPILAQVALMEKNAASYWMKSFPEGLGEKDAASRWGQVGPNIIAATKHRGWPWRLLNATRNPLVVLLTVLAAISYATGDACAGTVMDFKERNLKTRK